MNAAPLSPTPAPPGFSAPAAGDGADPATSAFAILLAGLLPLAAPAVAVPRPPAAEAGLGGEPDLALALVSSATPAAAPAAPSLPSVAAAPAPPVAAAASPSAIPAPAATTPAVPIAAPAPAASAAAGTAVAPPAGGLPQSAAGEEAPAGAALALPPALQGSGLGLEPPAELSAGTGEEATLERLPLAPRLVAAPEAPRGERARTAPAGSPPAATPGLATPTVAAAAASPSAIARAGVPAPREDAAGPPGQVEAPPPAPHRQAPAAAPEVALAGAELLESAPGADGAAEPTVDGAEIAPGRAERAASESPSPSPRVAPPPPPPPVQIGIQIGSAASRRVERMVVQLEPAALGRVEVRLDFSHDNRVSAVIAADRPETLEVLQRDSRALERSLQDAGLRLTDNGLSFSLRQDQRNPQQGAASPYPALPAPPPRAPVVVADVRPLQWLSAERVLDIRI